MRTLKLPLLNCEINLILHWYANCVIWSNSAENQATMFATADAKLFSPAVTLSTDDNAKLLQESKSGFKRTINWTKFPSKVAGAKPIFRSLNWSKISGSK